MSETIALLSETDWPGLDVLLSDYPLPYGRDDDLNMSETAQQFRVSTNTVKSWLNNTDNPMPYVARGSNGRQYVLRLSWCYAWRCHKEQSNKKPARISETALKISLDDEGQGLSPKQVREVAEAKMKHAEAALMLGKLTEIEAVYRLFEQIFVKIRNSAMGMPDRLERELSLTAPQARQVDRAMEEMLSSLIEEFESSVIGRDFTPNLEMNARLMNEA